MVKGCATIVNRMEWDELAAALLRSLAAQLVADGVIDPSGMTQEEFRSAFLAEMQGIREEGSEVKFILDHQDSVLEQARIFEEAEKADFAVMFYATWVEHWLNDMIVWKLQRAGTPQSDIVQLIRVTNLKRKIGKVWTDTFGEELDQNLVTCILALAERRNSFVHYKWQALEETEIDSEKAGKDAVLSEAANLVQQLEALKIAQKFGTAQGLLDSFW